MTELEEAQRPETTPERLTSLAKSAQPEVVSAVTANPSTPAAVLSSLTHRFPAQLLQNPVLPLLLLEDPGFLQRIPSYGVCALLTLTALPDWLIAFAAKHTSSTVRSSAAKHPLTPPDILWALSKDRDKDTLLALIENPNTPAEILGELASRANSSGVRMALARNPRTPEAALLVLREDRNAKVRSCVALNPQTPLTMLEVFAQETERDVLCAVAQNPKTPPELLAKLSTAPNTNIRVTVAQNINTPIEILERYAADANGDIRKAAAKNPMTPSDTLQGLKKDKNEAIRDAAKQQLQERQRQGLDPQKEPTDYQPETFLQRNKKTGRRIPN